MNLKIYSAITRQFLRFIEELSPQDIAELESKQARLEFSLKRTKQRIIVSDAEIQELAKYLKAAETKSSVEAAIANLSKDDLTKLCRILDLPTQNSDKIERIQERIVQSTIGFKTRSQAIQG